MVKISCNRTSRKTIYISSNIKKSSSITCGYSWFVCFKAVEYNKCANADQVPVLVITRNELISIVRKLWFTWLYSLPCQLDL